MQFPHDDGGFPCSSPRAGRAVVGEGARALPGGTHLTRRVVCRHSDRVARRGHSAESGRADGYASERSGFFVGVPTFRRRALGAGGTLSGATSTIGVRRCEPPPVVLQ